MKHENMSVVNLLGCNIVELDTNNEVLWAWTFPSVTERQQNFVLRKCHLDSDTQYAQPFVFAKCGKDWCYINTIQVFETDNLPRVKQFAFVIWAKDYNPEKYETLCRLLSKRYCKTGNPSVVLQLYLSVVTRGACTTEENGTFMATDFEHRKNNVTTRVKELIKLFGLETISIYTALLLKKKFVIYHHSLETLLKWIRTFPCLMLHRNFDDNTFPWFDIVDEEILELKSCNGFIAGCRDSAICTRNDIYDILVNLPAGEISISPYSRDSFVMTKTHKDIALFMVQLAENPNIQEYQVIQEISNKTEELLNHLRSLATITMPENQKMISVEILKEKNLAPALENLLFQLAVAENMIML